MAESSGTVEFTKPGQKFATPSPGAGDRYVVICVSFRE